MKAGIMRKTKQRVLGIETREVHKSKMNWKLGLEAPQTSNKATHDADVYLPMMSLEQEPVLTCFALRDKIEEIGLFCFIF